ncbi:MAG: hypothetical protein KAX44_01780, partial [Candidatus Brocadiae bacterium]|nr:hypothetical protein [Candidatus Brocadiia bacterium]
MGDYAHQRLVERNIDWCRVKDGLLKYPCIGKHFCLKELKSNTPRPYFCHWLSWRMSNWMRSGRDHCYLRLLEGLVAKGEKLGGWDGQRLKDPSYKSYWSILWELQVADALDRHPQIDDVQWLREGPDLRACVDGKECYVECYVYMKSCAALEYIKDLLRCLSPHFEVWHRISAPMGLPTGEDLVAFLDKLFEPFLDGGKFLAELKAEAKCSGRADVCVPDGACNLRIYLSDPVTLAPPDPNNAHGMGAFFGEGFVVDAIQKAIQN